MNFSDAKSIKNLQKVVTEGQDCQITGYLENVEGNLGRSLVIDLNSKGKSPYRQVDHRTINWIIYKNVKYTLGKKASQDDLPLKADYDNKWDASKLAVKNWFSSTAYYRVNSITDKDTAVVSEKKDSKTELKMARDIMETEMNSGKLFDSEQKMTRTEVLEKLMAAGECVMTVNFNKKVDEAHIKTVLEGAKG